MKFFTDKTVINEYLLIKLIDYMKIKDFSRWKEVFIDPGVYDLIKSPKFGWEGSINIDELLDSLPDNHYFSWDYPCDMNINYSDLFMEKTWNNALKYNLHNQYITTAQYKFSDYNDFKKWFDLYNRLPIKSGILGLGNMCRFRGLQGYLMSALDYAFISCNHPRIHIYGLCLRAIPYVYGLSKLFNIDVSIDSTKWTRVCNKYLRNKYKISCRKENRQEFFDEYLKEIKKRGVILENE